jgi:hypothetical protein
MKSISLLLATTYMLVMNGLANGLPLNGKTTGELSEQYPNWFVPAGITFSIWGVLYVLMIAYVGMRIYKRNEESDGIESLYLLTAVLNGTWIIAWHYEWMFASLLVMGGLLGTLVVIAHRIYNWHDQAHWLTKLTFGAYLGWIIVATGANVTAALVDWGWGGFGIAGPSWAAILIAVASLIAIATKRTFANPYILASVMWALIGILIKQIGGPADAVIFTAAIFLGILMREVVPTPTLAKDL